MVKKVIVAILMISILVFMVGCSKEESKESNEIVLPDGTVLPPPEEAGPLPPPPTASPVAIPTPSPDSLPDLPGTEAGPAGEQQIADPGAEQVNESTSEQSEVTVQIKDFKFVPTDLVVEKGTKVTWINLDPEPHTVIADNEFFDSGRLGNNEEFSFTFEEEGSWSYFCTFHPEMKANVAVE